QLLPYAGVRLLPGQDHPVHSPTFGGTTAHHALDTVPGHKIHGALRAALNGLPALDWTPQRPGHESQLFEGIATVGNLGRQRVMFALMRERFFVKRLEDDLDLFLEEFTIGRLIEERRPKRFDLPRMIATSYPKNDAPTGEDIGRSKILGQPQGMPHGGNVEAAANLNTLGQV